MGENFSLREILKPIRKELSELEEGIGWIIDSSPSYLRPVVELSLRGGKRIRPALAILSSRLFGVDERVIKLSVAIELLHAGTLIHDDILDMSHERRGRESIWKKYGERIAVLSGDLLFSKGISLISELGSTEIMDAFSKAIVRICSGEIRQDFSPVKSLEEYLSLAKEKTGSLFWASAYGGAYLGGASCEEVGILSEFGSLFGTAFQIADDIIDGSRIPDGAKSLLVKLKEEGEYLLREFEGEYKDSLILLFSYNINRAYEGKV